MKSDILDFLDKKFAKTVKKKTKKKKNEQIEVPQNAPLDAATTPILNTIEQAETKQIVTSETLYHALVKESEMPQSSSNRDPTGIKWHLKNDDTYDKHLKDKIFFIGQNAIQGNTQLMPDDVSL